MTGFISWSAYYLLSLSSHNPLKVRTIHLKIGSFKNRKLVIILCRPKEMIKLNCVF